MSAHECIILPSNDDGFSDLHIKIGESLRAGFPAFHEALLQMFGRNAADQTAKALLLSTGPRSPAQQALCDKIDRLGFAAFLEIDGDNIDWVDLTCHWRWGAEYAVQGIAPREPMDQPSSLADREQRLRDLVVYGQGVMACPLPLIDAHYFDIWEGVAARAAIDFGGTLSLKGLQILSGVTLGAIRNAISLGQLNPIEDGSITAEGARTWLERRRDFCPSRWRNPNDSQNVFDPDTAADADSSGMVLVPQDGDGALFTPEHVVRTSKSRPGLSITVGRKGFEEQYDDFYEALKAVAKMDVARWRRRNPAGNWGIVRARGAWVSVSKADIDRQLAAW